MGVERAKDVSQANQLMNLRKVNTLPSFSLSFVLLLLLFLLLYHYVYYYVLLDIYVLKSSILR